MHAEVTEPPDRIQIGTGRGRRHLDVALAYQPESACYHHLVATALDQDEDGDSKRARYHYRKAVELDPTIGPDYQHLIDNAFGLHASAERAGTLVRGPR